MAISAGKIEIQLAAEIQRLQGDLAKARGQLKNFETTAQKSAKAIKSALSEIAISAVSFTSFAAISKSLIDARIQTEKLNSVFQYAAGSIRAANTEIQYARTFAESLGLQFDGLTSQYGKLIAAAKGTGIALSDQRKLFEGLAMAGKVMGMSNDELGGSMNALQQMISKGKVSAEELRGQLGERLPGSVQIAARALGVTTQELDKMLEKGQILSKDFIPKFATQLQKEFGQNAKKGVDSVSESFNQLSNEISRTKTQLADQFAPTFKFLSEVGISSLRALRDGTKELGAAGSSFFEYILSDSPKSSNALLMSRTGQIQEEKTSGRQNAFPKVFQTSEMLAKSRQLAESRQRAEADRKFYDALRQGVKKRSEALKMMKKAPEKKGSTVQKINEIKGAQEDLFQSIFDDLEWFDSAIQSFDEQNQAFTDSAIENWTRFEDQIASSAQSVKDSIMTPNQALQEHLNMLSTLRDQGGLSMNEYAEAVRLANDQFSGSLTSQRAMIEESMSMIRSWGQQFTDVFVKAIMTGKFAFKDFANSVISDLLRMVIQKQITEPLFAGLFGDSKSGGGIFGGLFGGKRAMGGPVSSGKAYVVGEQGPEIMVPSSAGKIIPNSRIGSGGVNVSVQVINNSKSSVSVQEKETADGKAIQIAINDAMNKAMNDGSIDRAMRLNFGIARKGR